MQVTRSQQQVEHGLRVVAHTLMALARVALGHPRAEHDVAAERERRVRGVQRDHPAVAQARGAAEDPGTGALPHDVGVLRRARDARRSS